MDFDYSPPFFYMENVQSNEKKFLKKLGIWSSPPHKEIFPSPQHQPNQTCCTAGEVLLTWCAGLWARAQACHKDRKKTLTAWSYSFEAESRAAADFTFLQAGGPEGKLN